MYSVAWQQEIFTCACIMFMGSISVEVKVCYSAFPEHRSCHRVWLCFSHLHAFNTLKDLVFITACFKWCINKKNNFFIHINDYKLPLHIFISALELKNTYQNISSSAFEEKQACMNYIVFFLFSIEHNNSVINIITITSFR